MRAFFKKKWVIDCLVIPVGAALAAVGYAMFTVPNDIAPGGVSGLATALSAWWGGRISVGVLSLLLNVPLFAAAFRRFGVLPLAGTLASTVLLSVFTDLFGVLLPHYTNNVLLAAVLGGVLSGTGIGLLILRGYTTGGTDLFSMLLMQAFPNLSMSRLLLLVDGLVVAAAVVIFRDIEVALYSIVTIYVVSKVIDGILTGADVERVLYVITERGDEINGYLTGLDLGVTVVDAKGGFSGRQKQMLLVVTHRNRFAQTLADVKRIDPEAFLFVSNASEVHGEGFKPIR